MSTASQKTHNQADAAAAVASATTTGTGSSSSTRFRRQKIVPSVVARKIGANSNTKSTPKVASSKEAPKETPNHRKETQEVVAEVVNLQEASAHPIEAPPSYTAEESQNVAVKDDDQKEVSTSSAKPTTAFRRIKPKVAIPQTQKPAKSILKNSTTPVKEKPTVEQVDCVPTDDSILPVQQNSRTTVDDVSPQTDTVSVESTVPKQQSFPGDENQHISNTGKDINTIADIPAEPPCSTVQSMITKQVPLAKTVKRTIKLSSCGPQIANLLKGSIGRKTIISKPTEKAASIPNTLQENLKSQSTQMVVEQSKPSTENNASGPAVAVTVPMPEMRIDDVPSASTLPSAKDSVESLPGIIAPSNTVNATIAATKTIKKTYKLGNFAPQIADLLKASIGKKTTTNKPPTQTIGKVAAVSKPPSQLNDKLEIASLPSNTSHENLNNQSTSMVVEQSKPATENSTEAVADKLPAMPLDIISFKNTIVMDPQAAATTIEGKGPVLVSRLDNISPTEAVVTKPPPAPAEKVPIADAQLSGAKQIQKVHKLTPEQWQLALQSVKKVKSKTVPLSKAKKDNNNVAAPSPQATAPERLIVPQNKPPIAVPFAAAAAAPTKPSASMDVSSKMVNIISNIVLPPLNVFNSSPHRSANGKGSSTSPGITTAHQNIFSVSDGAVAITIPTTPPCTTATPATPYVPSIDSGQYPKLFILHQPAPSSPSTEQSGGRLKLAQHSLSVTVLPSHTVRNEHPPIGFSQKIPFALPTPEVTVRKISPKQTSYANAAPVPLPTPIISVTVTPAANVKGSNIALATRTDVPVDPRIVPKIVIDGCDTADLDDSQASHSSTSSSSSSCHNAVPTHQPQNHSDFDTTTPATDCSVTAGMGCSPDVRNKLRAKTLLNMRKKKECELGGELPRQYAGPAANKHQGNIDASASQHALTAGELMPCDSTADDAPKSECSVDTGVASQLPPTLFLLSPQSEAFDLKPQHAITAVTGEAEPAAAATATTGEQTSVLDIMSVKRPESSEPRKDASKKGRARVSTSKSKQAEAQKLDDPKSNDPEDKPCGDDVVAGSTGSPKAESSNNTVCDEIKYLESNAFFGYSSASIEHAVRDFADRARTIDWVLSKRQSTEEGTNEREDASEPPLLPTKEAIVEVDSELASSCGPVTENLEEGTCENKQSCDEPPSLPSKEDSSENFEKATCDKEDSSEPSFTKTKEVIVEVDNVAATFCRPVTDDLDHSGTSLVSDDTSFKKIEPTETAIPAVPDETDNTQQTEEPRENIAGTDVNLTERSSKMAFNDSVAMMSDNNKEIADKQENESNKSAEEVKEDCLEIDLEDPDFEEHDFAVAEPGSSSPEQPDRLNQAATGVDLIIAMAALRREKRILSVDDTSDREYEIGRMDPAPATKLPTPTPTPSTSFRDGPLGREKKRYRRKRRRDKLVKLLWKHVNFQALVDDLVNREKRHFGYRSSSEEKELSMESESDELTQSSDESLPEVTILNRILAKSRAASSSAADSVVQNLAECDQPLAKNDQRDEVEPSSRFIGDKSAEERSLRAGSVDPVAPCNEAFAQEPITTTTICDKIETNVATCDTTSSAVAELNNTQSEQVLLTPVSRKRRLAASASGLAKRKASNLARSKLYRTAPIEVPFDSSDGSRNEVVSDCSSDGLSTVEAVNSSRKPAYRARTVMLPSGSKGAPGRSRQRGRRYSSSSSSSNSSTTRNNDNVSRDGDLSSRGEPQSGKRRKLRRRKKRTERRTTTVVATVDCNTSPSTSTTSNLDAQFARQSGTGAAERNNHDVNPAGKQPPAAPGKNMPKRGRGRPVAASKAKQAQAQEAIVPKTASLSNDPEDEPLVKCGNCGGDVVAAAWEDHANYHNGAAYRVGVDATLNMKDVKALSTAILRFMKIYNRKELACERCGMVKKSGLGMASHYVSCGLSELEQEQSKASCVHCGRKMKAVSLLVHQQQHCRVLKEQQRQMVLSERDATAAATKETTASGRKKRKSVASAERMIKKMSKEINEDPIRELMVEVTGTGVSKAIVQCRVKHLQQSTEAVCDVDGCPFFGMTSEQTSREYGDNGETEQQKPLYQCSKCAYMSTSPDGIKIHISTDHPQLMRLVAAQRLQSSLTGGSDSDVYTGYRDGSSTTDDCDSFALDDEDEGKGNKGKGKKGKTKAKKAPSKAGSKAISMDLMLDSSMVSVGADETDVYKEMVLQESIEFKQDKLKYHIMSAKWTQEFRREQYTARLLFADLRQDVDTSYLRSFVNLKDYLPQARHSLRYVQCNSGQYEPGYTSEKFTHRWQQKGTFEGETLGCESLFFCGGPVVSLDWLPLPDEAGNDCDQFLAVACKQRYDEYYNCEQLAVPRRSHKCLVQIWNVGPIQNIGSTKITLRSPRLAFAIACDYGPIWQLAFCPSGCYNDPAQPGDGFDRLGLLAVAGSDGDVHLYALSRSMAGTENDASPRILPLRPVMLLSLSFSAESHNEPASDFTGRSVQRIAWSREKGHNVLAAGYSNGVVAVWNLSVKSSLLSGMKNGIRTLLPVHKVLHSSSSCITALDLHYSSGTRFLVVCNADRRLKVYDLGSGLYQPPETLSTVVRSRISAIRWMLHFPVLVIAYDDALYIDRCAYSVHQPRDIGLRMFNIFTVASEMTDLGTNDWHSMNAVATSGGDLVCHRPVPFVHGMNYKKLPQILTTTIPMKLKAINDSVDVSYYDAFAEEYGLLFCDTDKIPTAMDTTALHLKTWRRAKFNHYPAVRLNQIRWNPNSNAYTYYAIGYQAGFVRVRVLRT